VACASRLAPVSDGVGVCSVRSPCGDDCAAFRGRGFCSPNDRRLGVAVRAFRPARRGRAVVPGLDDSALDVPGTDELAIGGRRLRPLRRAGCVEDRAQLGGAYYRTQPAILLAQFARSAHNTPGIGGEMLQHSAHTAHLALHYIGATVLVVDPFDEDTDTYWREHWGLEQSERRVPGNRQLKRLWAAIPR
jgi:hypothetical protein